VSGYLEGDEDPLQRARTEIEEELGLDPDQASFVRGGNVLRAFDEDVSTVWVVHPFLFKSKCRDLRLDWEHTEHRWIKPDQLSSFDTVPKLKEAYDRVRWNANVEPAALSQVANLLEEFSQDRSHGASVLGRRAVEILAEAAKNSGCSNLDVSFRSILLTAWRLRMGHSGMATIGNLTGRLLYRINRQIGIASSVEELNSMVVSEANRIIVESESASEDASRNTVSVLPEKGVILTHSYSSTVRRALELGAKSGRRLTVYATESYPGFEGKQLAVDLVNSGVSVKLISDSSVASVMPSVDLVLVGADSVLADGSLIHKIGTNSIAANAKASNVPVKVSCETAKFDTNDFLGETPKYSPSLYDLTPRTCLSEIVTELGSLSPSQVEGQMIIMLRELYT
jgi:translation initiation factor 2B subunit (eIF-2B alpha/beta/delta family)